MSIKKYIALLVALLLLLSGCGLPESAMPPALPTPKSEYSTGSDLETDERTDVQQKENEDFTAETADISVELSYPQILIKIRDSETQRYFAPDDSGRLILSYLCEKPRVEIEGNEQASDRINEYLSDLEEEYYSGEKNGSGNTISPGFNKLLEKAYDNYQCFIDYKTDIKLDFEFSHYVDINRCDSKVICLSFKDFMDLGESEKTSREYAVMFDTESGEVIRLEENERFSDIIELVSEYFPAGAENTGHWDDCSFSLSSYGLTIGKASDSVNETKKTVPYSALAELNMDLFVPDEHDGNGTISVSDSQDTDSDLSIIDSVSREETKETLFLIINGKVSDFGILSMQYSNYDEKFYPKNSLWYSNLLSDCRIQLSLSIPEGMPDLMIRYTSEGIQYEKAITRSGMNGELYLTDLSIKAVG